MEEVGWGWAGAVVSFFFIFIYIYIYMYICIYIFGGRGGICVSCACFGVPGPKADNSRVAKAF